MQEAFSWRTEQGPSEEEIDMTPFSHPLLDTIDEKLREIEVIYNSVRSSNNWTLALCMHALQATTDDLPDIPDMPSNYVMDEFLKAREKANFPKEGTVKDKASGWYKEHHD